MNENQVKEIIKNTYSIPIDCEIYFNKNDLINNLRDEKKYCYVDYLNNEQLNYSRYKDIIENKSNCAEINVFIITDNVDEFNMFNMDYSRFKALSVWMMTYKYSNFVNSTINHPIEDILSVPSNEEIKVREMKAKKKQMID